MKVQSSAISDLEYEPETRTILAEYNGGGRYRFGNEDEPIPENVYQQVIASSSIGRAFQQLVKAKYPATKVS